jgi:vacuolar-type H+-ATPase subunit H
MPRQPNSPQSDDTVAAIERVLKAEREGVTALRRSEEQAQHLLAEARAEAANVARRADRCISRLHTDYLQKIDRDVEALNAARPALSDGDAAVTPDALQAAAKRIAARLTGAS